MSKLISLNQAGLPSPLEVELGDRLQYACTTHASIGLWADYALQGESVKFVDETRNFNNPNALEPGISGADEATTLFLFEAIAAGQSKVAVQMWFRGQMEHEASFVVLVKGASARAIPHEAPIEAEAEASSDAPAAPETPKENPKTDEK